MRIAVIIAAFALISISANAQPEGWTLFAKTKFDAKYNDKTAEYALMPTFSEDLKALVGKEITLEGYYLPIDVEGGQYVIISKFPYSQCFFCGGAGPESIAEVYFKDKHKFEADQYIRIKGKLKLNGGDSDHGNFMVEGAELMEKK
ncbi:MAG: hypothetical protein WDO14_17670 [Bacteroidota bacterium]